MIKIYLLLYDKESHRQFFKYFDTLKEKNNFKDKIKFSKKILLIEDSEDIKYE